MILAITNDRGWETKHDITYFDKDTPISKLHGLKPDLIIQREFNNGNSFYEDVFNLFPDVKKAYWFIDSHVASPEQYAYCHNFDYIFVAQSPYIERVKATVYPGTKVYYLPLCFPLSSDNIQPNKLLIEYLISFVGRFNQWFPERVKMIEVLRKTYPDIFSAMTDYDNMARIIKTSAITVNWSIKDDLNFRVFEALGYGTELVTNDVPDIDKIKGLRERIHVVTNMDEMIDSIKLLLENKGRVNTLDNQEWVKKYHTFGSRISEMLEMIKSGVQHEY